MAKAAPFAPKPAVEKLPLAVRKDIRDNYDSEKAELEAKATELLGTPFTFNINAGEVWAYNPPDSNNSAGGTFKRYAEGFVDALRRFIDTHGDEGKAHFNAAVTQSELTVNVNELGDKAETITADVKDGVFRILFHHQKLGYNQSYLEGPLLKAIESVPREGLSLVAKTSIETHWNSEVDDLTTEIGEIIGIPDVVLDPNFEENFAALAVKDNKSWEESFGRATFAYFSEGLKSQLSRQGFKGDEMLQEGLGEVFESKTFKLRVVKTIKTSYTEVVIEDGIVYLQTVPAKWYTNVSDMGNGLVDLL